MIQDEYLEGLKPASKGGRPAIREVRLWWWSKPNSKSEFEEGSNPKCGEIIGFIWIDVRLRKGRIRRIFIS
jgi:hypothetical protein